MLMAIPSSDLLSAFLSEGNVLPGMRYPVYTLGRSCGQDGFYFEQRQWLHALSVVDKCGFRKDEKKRQTMEKLLKQYQLVRQIAMGSGSRETIARSLMRMDGLGSLVKAAHIRLYEEEAQEQFKESRRLQIGYDGSTHGGHDVVAGYAISVEHRLAMYMRPMVPLLLLFKKSF